MPVLFPYIVQAISTSVIHPAAAQFSVAQSLPPQQYSDAACVPQVCTYMDMVDTVILDDVSNIHTTLKCVTLMISPKVEG